MNKNETLTVTFPPLIFRLILTGLVILTLVNLLNLHFRTATTIEVFLFSILVVAPVSLAAIYVKLFRINIIGDKIFVRKFFGLVNFVVTFEDIESVKWNIIELGIGRLETVKVLLRNDKNFIVNKMMVNSNLMYRKIKENVHNSKIVIFCK